ncbi:MAG: hypothetical protein ACXV5Q_00780 [Frankiaceae bacterium]
MNEKGRGLTHDCPDAANLRPGSDDLCDLPEPVRRLAYVGNYVPGDHSWVHDRCPGKFCPHAVFSEAVAAFPAVNR